MHECTRDNERYIDLDCQQPFLTFVDTQDLRYPAQHSRCLPTARRATRLSPTFSGYTIEYNGGCIDPQLIRS